MSKIVIAIFIILLVAGGVWFLFSKKSSSNITSTPISTPTYVSKNQSFFNMAEGWVPDAKWGPIKNTDYQALYGNLGGEKVSGEVTSKNPSISRFSNDEEMAKLGFEPDINLSADGPGASNWGYKKTKDGTSQVAIFSYSTQALKGPENQPMQFTCPCEVFVSAFLSDPFKEETK